MVVDASAMVAMLLGEAGADALADRLAAAPRRLTSAIALFETVAALCRVRAYAVAEAKAIVNRFLALADIELAALGADEGALAVEAFDRFGKGRHPAALNMGDCFAYALAKARQMPLLYVGGDFARTDLAVEL